MKKYKVGHMEVTEVKDLWQSIERTPEEAEIMKLRAELMMMIETFIKENKLTQAKAASLFGVTQPRISDLLRGKINLFSLDMLISMATSADMPVQIKIKKPKSKVLKVAVPA